MRKLKKDAHVKEIHPTQDLADEDLISKAIWECLKNNDPEGVIEVLQAHLEAVNMLKFSKEAHIPRATLYHFLQNKNPTLKTLAKVVHSVT